jgi:hypothetical protein
MSPTYERSARFGRDMRKLTGEQRRAFLTARDELVAGLRTQPLGSLPGCVSSECSGPRTSGR